LPDRVAFTATTPAAPAWNHNVIRYPAFVFTIVGLCVAARASSTKVAPTDWPSGVGKAQVGFVPLHAPVHADSANPAAGLAVSVTDFSDPTGCVHTLFLFLVLAHAPSGPTIEPAPLTVIERSVEVRPPEPVNVAVTLFAFVIATEQLVLVPEHAPPQPLKVPPKVAVAVRVMVAPAACGTLQPEPPELVQLRPPPAIVPLPVTCPLSVYVVFPPAKSASAVFVPFIVKVHVVDVNAEQSPIHLVKSALFPEAATALSATVVFAVTFVVHPAPPAAVQWMAVAPTVPTT
jgi:hypothetical protein